AIADAPSPYCPTISTSGCACSRISSPRRASGSSSTITARSRARAALPVPACGTVATASVPGALRGLERQPQRDLDAGLAVADRERTGIAVQHGEPLARVAQAHALAGGQAVALEAAAAWAVVGDRQHQLRVLAARLDPQQ